MSEDTQYKEVFDANIESGKDAVIMALHSECKLPITTAVRTYTQLARSAGVVLDTKARTDRINAVLIEQDPASLQTVEGRKELIEQFADEFDISTATAAQHIKKFCDENDIELPTVQRTSLEDMVAFVKDKLDEGSTRSEVVEALQEEMGYTANTAASAYSRATRELGLSTGRTGPKASIADVVTFMRNNLDLGRKAAAKKMHDEIGYAEATAMAFYTYLPLAQEYARQELEAASE